MIRATIDHQKQMRSQGGASLRGCCALVPVDRPQASRDRLPVMAGRRLRISDLLPNSAGLHGSAILSNSHPQRVPSPYLRCHGRQVERIAPCRFRVPLNFINPTDGPRRQAMSAQSKIHLSRLRLVGGSNEDHSTRRISRNAENLSQGHGNV